MNRRTPSVRFLAILWATLQLASPGVSAIADGRAARESIGDASSHVEATSTERCPVVHAPDCGICRYLSHSSGESAPAQVCSMSASADPVAAALEGFALQAAIALPRGRAPPAS